MSRHLVIYLLAAMVAVAAGLLFMTMGPVDRCLDRGGRWSSVDKKCHFE